MNKRYYKIKIINWDGQGNKEFTRDKKPELAELQEAVGGFIELVRLGNGKEMYVNEEGKLTGLKLNYSATKMYRAKYPNVNDVIVGNVIYIESVPIKQTIGA